jgi:putative copper export protein
VYHLVVFVHVLSAIVWVGGVLFLALVAIPVLRGLPDRQRADLVTAVGLRFRGIAWGCILLLVLSGIATLAMRGIGWDDVRTGRLWQTPFGRVLAWKLVVVAAMVALGACHDFVLGPASARAGHSGDPADARAARVLRRRAAWVGRAIALLALLVVALAVLLVRGVPRA